MNQGWNRNVAQEYLKLTHESRLQVLHPALIRHLDSIEGARVLDFGCGDAALVPSLVSAGAAEVIGIDYSEAMLERARVRLSHSTELASCRIELRTADEDALSSLGTFDVIICSLVLMMASSEARMRQIVARLISALRTEGSLLVAVTHPCFRLERHSSFWDELPSGFSYWDSGRTYKVHIHNGGGKNEVIVEDYHWTLGDYFKAIELGGGCIVRGFELGTKPSDHGRFADEPAYWVCEVRRRSS